MTKLWPLNTFWLLLLLVQLGPIYHCHGATEKNFVINNSNNQEINKNINKNSTNIVEEFQTHFKRMTEIESEFPRRLAIFSLNVYNQISLIKPNENIVFSPFSIQTCGAMARLGAKGKTAEELDRGLGLVSNNIQDIVRSFHGTLDKYKNSNILQIANKIFVMKGYQLDDNFNKLLSEEFLSSAENLDFSKNNEAALTINNWVKEKTKNLINDLIAPSLLSAQSRLVLVNAIHFKGTWEHKFSKGATHDGDFYISETEKKLVPMMRTEHKFLYADLPELDASALRLSYKDSDLSMLVILPKNKTGLPQLEERLRSTPLSEITKKLSTTSVIVKLPKFKAEFSINLDKVFQNLGMSNMFSDSADFSGMLQSPEPLKVSAIVHKAFIEVNEEGTEAAAATGIVVRKKRCIISLTEPIEFFADHPFTYALLHQTELPLFWGSVVHLDSSSDNCPTTSQEHDEL